VHSHLFKLDFVFSGFELFLLFCQLLGPGFKVACHLCFGSFKSFKLFLESKSLSINLLPDSKIILLPNWRDRFFNLLYVLCLLSKEEVHALLSKSGFPLVKGL
jgi:hypothetical protein